MQAMARLALRRARAVASSSERVIWYGRAAIAQYRLAAGKVPLDIHLLRDDPTGMVAADVIETSNELERRHHPHLFDCTSWLRQVPEEKETALVRRWAAHCAFRLAEVRSYVARTVGLPARFDGTMPKRLRALAKAIVRSKEAATHALTLALAAGDDKLAIAATARLVMLFADFSAKIVAVPLPESYESAAETAALLRQKQVALALPWANTSRRLLRRLNRMQQAKRHPNDPWLKAARIAVLAAPRDLRR